MTPEERKWADWCLDNHQSFSSNTQEALTHFVTEERERVGWRNFKDRQPEDESVVLVTANGQAATIQYLGENWHWTHWMPYVNPEEDA